MFLDLSEETGASGKNPPRHGRTCKLHKKIILPVRWQRSPLHHHARLNWQLRRLNRIFYTVDILFRHAVTIQNVFCGKCPKIVAALVDGRWLSRWQPYFFCFFHFSGFLSPRRWQVLKTELVIVSGSLFSQSLASFWNSRTGALKMDSCTALLTSIALYYLLFSSLCLSRGDWFSSLWADRLGM